MPSAPGSLTCQSGTVPTFQNFSENEGTVGGKRVAGTCSSPVRAPCWSQGSDFLSGAPLGEHGVCRPSLGRELRVWDVWAQRWGRSRPRWALQAEVLSVTVAGARRCHGKETTEASARDGRGCQRPPGCVHSQARWVSPSPAMKAAPSVSQAGVSLPQHRGHLFQTWPCAGLSRALWGGSSIPGPCPHEASSSAQLWPPRGLLDMAECPLGSKAAGSRAPELPRPPCKWSCLLRGVQAHPATPCGPECRARPGRITQDKAITVGRVCLGKGLGWAAGRRGGALGGAEGTEVAPGWRSCGILI